MDRQDVIHWLQEGEEWSAAELVSQCEFSYHYVDTGFSLDGSPDIDIVVLDIQTPRRILDRLSSELREQSGLIENAIQELARANHCYVRDINWIAKVGRLTSPSDSEIEHTLARLDSEHVRTAWSKALNRRTSDPDGAITSAKTLVESVCKHILNSSAIPYQAGSDITTLYHLVAQQLNLSPNQYIDKNMKRILGSCQVVVSGIAFLRNQLGDAHAHETDGVSPTCADAELAINLAGAIATFLVKTWENKNTFETE